MWVQVKTASSLIVAEMWKEFFEGEGIPTWVRPEGVGRGEGDRYRILVPRERTHLVEEVLRKV